MESDLKIHFEHTNRWGGSASAASVDMISFICRCKCDKLFSSVLKNHMCNYLAYVCAAAVKKLWNIDPRMRFLMTAQQPNCDEDVFRVKKLLIDNFALQNQHTYINVILRTLWDVTFHLLYNSVKQT